MSLNEVRFCNVVAGYDGTTVLEQISFELRRGQRLGLIGRNGAGKTTTLATAIGLTHQLAGQITFDGRNVSLMPTSERARQGLGYVAQTRDIFASLTVEENLCAGLQGAPMSRLDEAYALFPSLAKRRKNQGNQLSGGEQQMLCIARALMSAPDLLLLDEPLEGLSPVIAQEVMATIRRLVSDRGMGCLLVEQHVDLVLDFCDTVLVMERGQIMFNGSPDALRQQPDILEQCIGLRKIEDNMATEKEQ